jgi:histidinol-phosphatase
VLADDADSITTGRFKSLDLHVMSKPDLTPVTDADEAVEESIRRTLSRVRSRDAVTGEEQGTSGHSQRRWIVDPIDGTRNYSRGIPVWATLIALEEDGVIRLGVVSAPALGRRWWAERGAGAFVTGDPIRVSRVAEVEDAVLCFALEQPLPEIAHRCWHPRAYGDFWAHMLVAEGAVDGAFDAIGVKIWDLAALQPIVEEAGGRFTDRDGSARADGLSAVSSNGLLHDSLLERTSRRSG